MKLQKFYKFFTWSVLIMVGAIFSSTIVSSQQANPPKQTNCLQDCCEQQIFVLENSQDKAIHLVYDFTRGTVTTVTVRKGYLPPDVITQTKRINQ